MRPKFLDNISDLPKNLPLLISNTDIVLPGCMVDFTIQDTKISNYLQSKLKNRYSNSRIIIGVANSTEKNTIGIAASLQSFSRVGKEFVTLVGICRFRIQKIISRDPYISAEITQLDFHKDCEDLKNDPKIRKLVDEINDTIITFLDDDISSKLITDTFDRIPPCYLAEMIAYFSYFSLDEQLKVLNTLDVAERLKYAVTVLKTKKKENFKSTKIISKPGQYSFMNEEVKKLQERIKKINFPQSIKSVVENELKELSILTPISPSYNVIFSHLSLVADLPWNKLVKETLDLHKTKKNLEVDHYGLDKVKTRILEYLAVRKLRNNANKSHQGPILCLVGPPGVGKTSIARSIAATLNRPLERVSLGGVNNMSDIRGHRRTYIGAMPGRIIQALKRCGVKNPVILLDEIDKMSIGYNGDPAAALLEVLDPAQNKEFLDHYLNIPFDLSDILFIATANTVHKLTSALYDRLEIIHIAGYTYLEKLQIAKKYLLPKQMYENGLELDHINIPEETLKLLINNYTHEAGVRSLERKIGALCRSVAVTIAMGKTNDLFSNNPVVIDTETAKDILGPVIRENNTWISRLGRPGVAVGLVVSSAGGDTIAVESSFMPGNGKLVLTGSLGEVMKESAQLAWGWVRSNIHMYGVELNGKRLNSIDVHIHFPEGAISKDGPSAGVTVAASLMSLFLDRPLLSTIAMTGEITLQGVVLPVGGIKEKVISAHKDGFTKIIIPQENEKHLYDIPTSIKNELTFVLVSDMHTIIETIFENGVNLLIPHCSKSKL